MVAVGNDVHTSKQSTDGPDTQRSMIEYLHGDEDDKPHRSRLLEELVIVDTDIEFPDLS